MSRRLFRWGWVILAGLLVLNTLYEPGSGWVLAVKQSAGTSKGADMPVLDYEAATRKAVSKERGEKNNRFNGRGAPERNKRIRELPDSVEPLPTSSHWWVGLPALPVGQSDVIILGEVAEAEAHLSGDGTGIYSEFSVWAEEVFKDATGSRRPGSLLSVNRVGGAVRFPSGRVQEYRTGRQGMPRKGGRYALFLKETADGDLLILTGYELSAGRVTPLDGEDDLDPRSALPFARYRGAEPLHFLHVLRAAVKDSLNTGGAQ